MIISHSFLHRMRNVSDKICKDNNLLCSITFFNHAIYDVMWKNTVEPDRPQIAMWCMCTAHRITKAKNTHTHTQNM
jgi:hypothetical protein